MTRIGWVLSALSAFVLLASAAIKFSGSAQFAEGFAQRGWPLSLAVPLGVLEIAVVLVYLLPRTAVLGAILATGYLGGAIAAHVRVGEPYFGPLLIGMAIWGGLYFRDSRLRALIPFRS